MEAKLELGGRRRDTEKDAEKDSERGAEKDTERGAEKDTERDAEDFQPLKIGLPPGVTDPPKVGGPLRFVVEPNIYMTDMPSGDLNQLHKQGGMGLSARDESLSRKQQHWEPFLVKSASNLHSQDVIRVGGDQPEETKPLQNMSSPYNLTSMLDIQQQSTIIREVLKQHSQDKVRYTIDEMPRFFQNIHPEVLEKSPPEGESELGDGDVASEEEKDLSSREECRLPSSRDASRWPSTRKELLTKRTPRDEELVLSASKLNCHGLRNCSK